MRTHSLLTAAFALGLIATSSAQVTAGLAVRVAFAEGHGTLTNREGQTAEFAFRVRKPDHEHAQGSFKFATFDRHHGHVNIATEHINRLVVDGNRAAFGGPAVMRVVDAAGHVREFHGELSVHVVDNAIVWHGHHRRHVDLMELTFAPTGADWTYSFSGSADPRSMRVGYRWE